MQHFLMGFSSEWSLIRKYSVKCIYVNNPNIEFWLKMSKSTKDVVVTQNLEEWLIYPRQSRISMHEEVWFVDENTKLVSSLVANSALCMIFMPEFVTDSWCQKFDQPNVIMFLGGHLNWQPQHATVSECFYLLWSTCDFYRAKPALLNVPKHSKTHYFDVLLGRRKHHRDYLYNNIDHAQNIVTYFPTNQDQDITQYSAQEFQWPTDVLAVPQQSINFTVQEVVVDGTIVSLSQIIPHDIYKRTWYSVVAETETNNNWSFFTEKIVKPILAQRLFLVCSGQYYLRNLRKLGFQTFDGIIDEGYDVEPDLAQRMNLVLEQIQLLCKQDPVKIQQQIKTITDHNFHVMTTTNWQQRLTNEIRQHITELS